MRCAAPSKLPWMSDCMAGSSSDAPSPPTMAQKMTIAVRLWAKRHRQGADGVAEQTQHVGPLAPDEIADLAADQDERGRDQRLERDRRLDAADGRVEILDHRRDRHVHQRRVDDEHEHRHGQQEREPRIGRSLLRIAAGHSFGHGRSTILARCRARVGESSLVGIGARRERSVLSRTIMDSGPGHFKAVTDGADRGDSAGVGTAGAEVLKSGSMRFGGRVAPAQGDRQLRAGREVRGRPRFGRHERVLPS